MIQLSYSPGINRFLQTDQKLKTRYRPDKVESLSRDLVKKCDLFTGNTLSVEDIKSLSRVLAKALNTGPGTFIGVLQHFRVYPLTTSGLLFLCRQMAAKKSKLLSPSSADVFSGALMYEWFPCKVDSVVQGEGSGQFLQCRFTDGAPVGLKFQLLLGSKSIFRFFLEGGVDRKSLRGVKLTSTELTNFKYYALIHPGAHNPFQITGELNNLPYSWIGGLRSTGTQGKHNKEVFNNRHLPCPQGLPLPCSSCFIGLDNCPRACRIATNWATNVNPPQEIHLVRKD
tara:strand:- start:673 stop:1524 length:852 start_codon:yes stop_codon:yes gene_type:complete